MNTCKIEKRRIKVSEYKALRNTTNWCTFKESTLKKALKNDLFSICIVKDKKTIGIGRVIGDGAIYFYIQDVIVLPEYRKQGVGHLIMKNIELFLLENAEKNAFVGLMAAQGVKPFYEHYKYQERSPDAPGMYKIIKK